MAIDVIVAQGFLFEQQTVQEEEQPPHQGKDELRQVRSLSPLSSPPPSSLIPKAFYALSSRLSSHVSFLSLSLTRIHTTTTTKTTPKYIFARTFSISESRSKGQRGADVETLRGTRGSDFEGEARVLRGGGAGLGGCGCMGGGGGSNVRHIYILGFVLLFLFLQHPHPHPHPRRRSVRSVPPSRPAGKKRCASC